MSALQPLESTLNDVFVKKAPALPENGKQVLIKYLPIINLVLGVLTLISVVYLWQWAHYANNVINNINSYSAVYGGPTIAVHRLGLGIWLGLLVLAAEAILYIAAYPATRDHQKKGWDLMFYALLLNILYAVVLAFTSYGMGNVFFNVIAAAVGFYVLFQIRAGYMSRPTVRSKS